MKKPVSKSKPLVVKAEVPSAEGWKEFDPPPAALVNAMMHPVNGATKTMMQYVTYGDRTMESLVSGLVDQCQQVNEGKLTRMEDMLTTQLHTLDAIFNKLAQQAALNIGEHMGAADTYLRLALRAQAQCRSTSETLALIKNPPNLAFVKQQNIAHGHQQVNNGVMPEGSRVEEVENPQSKLLEANSGNRLDTQATAEAGRANSEMETVGEIQRT